MNDDELIEALRRTLHSRAAALRPKKAPIHVLPRPGADPAPRRVRSWPRPLVLAGVGIAAAAAAVTAVLLTVPGPRHTAVSIVTNGPSTTPLPTVPATTAPPVSVTTTSPPTTLAPLPAVPSGFRPVAVTFISPRSAWVLGTVPCGSSMCAAVARTRDDGAHWGLLPAPSITFSGQEAVAAATIRFLDGDDGWIVAPAANLGTSELWYTIDGGRSWQSGPVPGGSTATVAALEASKGSVHALAIVPGNPKDIVYSSPPGLPQWTDMTEIPRGGGPVPTGEITLFGSTGWIIANDRTASGGAILGPDGRWTSWSLPCLTANGSGLLAASSAGDLFALCHEGVWGPSASNLTGDWLFASNDGGQTFTKVGSVGQLNVSYLTSAADDPTKLVAATAGGLAASFDGGRSWQPVYSAPAGSAVSYVGYTTGSQAVAILRAADGSSSSLLMTEDGGHTWSAVSF